MITGNSPRCKEGPPRIKAAPERPRAMMLLNKKLGKSLKKRSWIWLFSTIKPSGKIFYRKWMMLWNKMKIINNWQKPRWWLLLPIILDFMISCAWPRKESKCLTICFWRDNLNTWRMTVNRKKQRWSELWLTFLSGSHKLFPPDILWPIQWMNFKMGKMKLKLTITFKWQ